MSANIAAMQADKNPARHWLAELIANHQLNWRHTDSNLHLLLAELLEVTGWQGDVHGLCDALPKGDHVINLSDILGVMGTLGYRIKKQRHHSEQLMAEDLPGLFVFDKPAGWLSAAVLCEINIYGLIWTDGNEHHRGNLPSGKGTLYRFERIVNQSTDDEMPVDNRQWLKSVALRFRPLFWHIAGLSLCMHIFTLAMPLFSMVVYDRVIAAHSPGTLPMLGIGVASALVVEKLIRHFRIMLAGWLGTRSSVIIVNAMFERLLFLPSTLIEQASVSSQLARLRAFESVRDFLSGPLFLIVLESPFILVLILVITMLAGPVAFVPLAVMAIYGLLLLTLRGEWKKQAQEAAHQAALKQQQLLEITAHVKAIYAANISDRIWQRFRNVSWQAALAQKRFTIAAAFIQQLAMLLTIIAGIIVIHLCLNRIWEGQMSGGAMVATMILTWRALYPLQLLCTLFPNIEQIKGALGQVSALMQLQPESHAAPSVMAKHEIKGELRFNNVGLRYSRKSDPVFYGLNGMIEAGQTVAIYGNNGTGKSSILKLIMGLYPSAIGKIQIDGIDHRQFDPRILRRQIAYLPQHPELMPGTIADNLRMANPLAPDFKLRQALLWADNWEIIEALPAGLDTVIGSQNFTPSSGFAARLCLARLYLAERPIVLCDELPPALMNSSTGDHYRRYIMEAKGKQTLFYVTHREDMLSLADQIIWLKPDGKVITGTLGKECKITPEELAYA